MKNLNKIVHLYLNTLPNLENKDIIVGFSGGADSTALLHIMAQKREHFKFNLSAVFFSHGTSPIAKDEDKMLKFCQNFCFQSNISLQNVDLDLVKIPRQGWESSGRQARLSFYSEQKADFIFLGHHKDDQNETTMTQLFRGAGKGASAMKPLDGVYCRPFLNVLKTDIYSYLIKQDIQWVEDPTNTDTHFTRNFWRNIGLPTIEKHYPQYSQSLDNFRRKNTELHDLAYELAVSDGLNLLIEGHTKEISGFSDVRLKNLIVHYFQSLHVTAEDSFFEQQIAHYNANKKVDICLKEHVLYLQNDTISNTPLTHSISQRLKIK